MSASREKKNRQEVAASGVADPKTARQAQEQAKERRSNRLYAIIAIAFVVVAIGLVVWNSNIIQRGTTAVTVEGESYSAAEVSYYYHNAYNSIVNSKYASLYGIDKNTSLSQQSLNDTAKMMLRVSEDMTWDAYFRDAAKKSLIQLTMLKKGAAEKGMTFNDDMQKEVDRTVETFSTYAKKAGYSTSAYLKLMYGNNMTMSTFKSILKDTLLASHYQQDYIDSLTYTDEEVETYYNEHKNNFDVADYEYIYFKGTADSTKDADGNTVKPTDEENAAAKEAASANANAALEAVRNGLLMEKAAGNYDNGTYTDRPTGTYSGDAVTEWVFNEERQEGDLTLIESGDNYYVVLFHSRGRNDYNTVDVRHILFKVDTSDLDSKADDYQEKLDARKAEQKEAAEAAAAEEAAREARHVVAASYEFYLPAYWDGRVTVEVDGNNVTIRSKAYPRLTVCEVQVQRGTAQFWGDIGRGCMGEVDLGQGHYASVWATNWGYTIGELYMRNSTDPDDYYSLEEATEIVDLQTGGAVTYEQIRDAMIAADAAVSGGSEAIQPYLEAQIVDTIQPL